MGTAESTPLHVGRYAIFDRIAAGGMATVHLARLVGEAGFARTVAVKRLHAQFALDPEFVAMLLDEARLAARIRHPNVVATVDIVNRDDELFLVMEYVDGEPFSTLLGATRAQDGNVPVDIAVGVVSQMLHGLHAAHEATNDLGEPLHIVHRDVSPQNVLVGTDGVVRVIDFGVAKALGKLHTTREGQLKGKLGYLAPEQVLGQPATRRSDVFAAAVVLWETIAGKRLFSADSEGSVLKRIMEGTVEPPSKHAEGIPAALDAAVLRALAKEPADRFDTALTMAEAIEEAAPPASTRAIGQWIKTLAGDKLAARAQLLAAVESSSAMTSNAPSPRVEELPTIPDEPPQSHTGAPVASDRHMTSAPHRGSWAWVAIGGIAIGGGIATSALLRRAETAPTLVPAPSGTAVPSTEPGAGSLASPLPPAASDSSPAANASGTPPRVAPRPSHLWHPRAAPSASGPNGRK